MNEVGKRIMIKVKLLVINTKTNIIVSIYYVVVDSVVVFTKVVKLNKRYRIGIELN